MSKYDYVTVGHVTVDVLNGARRPGGSAFYSALQAARLGARVLIATRGVPAEIEELLDPYAHELELQVTPASRTTTLKTSGRGATRRQTVQAWAGPMTAPALQTGILHLAPIARELDGRGQAQADFVGLTPQGLLRRWGGDGEISLAPTPGTRPSGEPPREAGPVYGDTSPTLAAAPVLGDVSPALGTLTPRCDAVVLSQHERASAAKLLEEAVTAGTTVAITAGAGAIRIQSAQDKPVRVNAIPIDDPRDDVGAGDVFAAAFFVALHEGHAPVDAATFAAAAATVRIEGDGPVAIGDRAAIEGRLRRARP
jgi:hypothetical protein